MSFSAQDFDEILQDLYEQEHGKSLEFQPIEYYTFISPDIWNGYWNLNFRQLPKYIRKIFKNVGLKFHNKYLYWVGFPIVWEKGFREILEEHGIGYFDESTL